MATKPEIKKLLQTLNVENFDEIFPQLKNYFATGDKWLQAGGLFDEIPPYNYKNLTSEQEAQLGTLMASPTTPTATATAGDVRAMVQSKINDAVGAFFDGQLFSFDEAGTPCTFRCHPPTNTYKVMEKHPERLNMAMVREFRQSQEEIITVQDGTKSASQSVPMVKAAIVECLAEATPLETYPVAWSDDMSVPAIGRPVIVPDSSIPFPVLEAFFNNVSSPELLAAWIYGVYSNRFVGRRMVYLMGVPNSGKSTRLGRLIHELMNNSVFSFNSKDAKDRNQFFTSSLQNAKMAMIPDCDVQNITETELLKNISGRDNIRIEHKQEAAKSVTLDSFFLIISNRYPSIKGREESTSRLLPMRIMNPVEEIENVGDVIAQEAAGFLAWAQDCYENLHVNNHDFKLDEECLRLIEEATREGDKVNNDAFHDNFVADPTATITHSEISAIVARYPAFARSEYKQQQFNDYLVYKHKMMPVETVLGSRHTTLKYKGIRLKTSTEISADGSADYLKAVK